MQPLSYAGSGLIAMKGMRGRYQYSLRIYFCGKSAYDYLHYRSGQIVRTLK